MLCKNFTHQNVYLSQSIRLLHRVASKVNDHRRCLLALKEAIELHIVLRQSGAAEQIAIYVEEWIAGEQVNTESFVRIYIDFLLAKAEACLLNNKVHIILY